jgi:hypothetical protein
MSWTSDVRRAFVGAGWQELQQPVATEGRLHGLFAGGFAVCGVRVLDSSAEVSVVWPDLQSVMAELKTVELRDSARDYYLIFVVSEIDDASLAALQAVLDDPRVCRKICLDLRGRSIGEALLEDIPFLSTPGITQDAGTPEFADILLEGIPEAVQRDLEFKSAERIFEALVSGVYESSETD